MSETSQLIFAGEGGQGLIVGGRILARAAIIEGKNVVQTQSYGISARGGYSEAQVLISSHEIHHPQCDDPDLVLALTQEAFDRYKDKVRNDCTLIYEQKAVSVPGGGNKIGFPFADTCLDIGDKRTINVLFLGVVLKNLPLVSKESMLQSIQESLPPKIHDINVLAFERGLSGP
jgi:2-oxoglutarate ferredoxin oxidoreductase subunit gamma